MTHYIENSILVHCDECILDTKKRIRDGEKFSIKRFCDTIEESRKETIKFIISTLYHSNDCRDTPQSCRKNITESLAEHKQFTKEEIDEIFDDNSYKSTDYSNEFVKNHPEIDFTRLIITQYAKPKEESSIVEEEKYNFPFSSCDYRMFIGFCKMDVEILKCPDCGNEVTNTPDNVTIGHEHDLVCPVCSTKKKDEFDNKGLIKVGRPTHHGNWQSQKPELIYTGTDYFAILHPKCAKSPRPDKKGFMEVNGLWVDDCGRIVLSLECIYCGARNALKPFTKSGGVPLLNESGAEWKHVKSPILEIIEEGESDRVEFKSSLRWDYKENRGNKGLEYVIVKSISGFMNAEGGILLIGVSNLREILGIEKDYSTLGKGKKDKDGFELQLTDVINNYIGREYQRFIKVVFEELYHEEICYIEIGKSLKPAYIKKDGKIDFVIRAGNRTQTLDVQEATEYIKMHWRE